MKKSTTDNKNNNSVSWDECRRWRVSTQICDVLRKTVPDPSGGDRESLVAVDWQSGTGYWQSWRWSWPKTLSELSFGWMMKFVGKVGRRTVLETVETFKSKHCQFEINPPRSTQPMLLTQEWASRQS